MANISFVQLVDIEHIRQLLEAQYRITGILSAILDTDENILVAVGWQDICTRFHRVHPGACARCRESDAYIKAHLQYFNGEYLDYRCKNGLRDVAVPIIIGGAHLATLFTGQFFYDDEKPDMEYFRAQAEKFGFDTGDYLEALGRVPICSRDQVRNIMNYYGSLVKVMAEMGLKNLELSRAVREKEEGRKELLTLNEDLENRVEARTSELATLNSALLKEIDGHRQAEQRLALMNFALDHVREEAYLVDEEARFRYVNEEACRVLGYSREELLAMKVPDIDPDYQPGLWPDHWRQIREYGSLTFETRHRARDGRIYPIEITVSLIKYEGREYILGLARDITERKHAERRLQLLNFAIDHMHEGVYLCDENAGFSYVNEESCRALGYSRDTLLGLKVPDIDPDFPIERWHDAWRQLRTDGSVMLETRHKTVDGRIFPVEIHTTYIEFDGRGYGMASARDITERKKAEAELKTRQRQLEELNETLENRVEEELAKNRAKDIMLIQQNRQAALGEMLDHIAHQWKQPINSISLIIQDLEEAGSCGELTKEYIGDAVRRTYALLEHMAQTIEVFRDFYRPEKVKKVFRIKDSIDMAVGFTAPAFRLYSIAVELDVDPGLLAVGYPKEYAQVLLNILGNARNALVERRTEKPRVKLRAFEDGAYAVVAVTDNAGGILDVDLDKIFEPYFTTRKMVGGTGIGLYMSKNIIENSMGGRLSAGIVEGGAQFRIEIPLP